MKRFLLGGVLAIGLIGVNTEYSFAQDPGPFSSTIVYRSTDFVSGTGTVNNLTPYFSLTGFDTVGGQFQLTSVSINYTLRLRRSATVTNTAPAGTANADFASNVTSTANLFFSTNGTTAGDLNSVGGQFIKVGNLAPHNTAQSLTVNDSAEFFNVAPGEQRSTGVRNVDANTTFNFSATGSGGPGVVNDAVVNQFTTGSPIFIGIQTLTSGQIVGGGGNVGISQVTEDQGELTVTYNFQPVPAPPAAISLGIGGLVGLLGTGAGKLRARRKQAAKKS